MAPLGAPSPHRTTALPVADEEEMKMTKNNQVVATALFLTFASLGQAGAADVPSANGTRHTYDVLSVVGAAYHDARVATNAMEVRRQGGFATAGAVRWTVAPDRSTRAAVVDMPSVIGAAYHEPAVATNAAEVRRQGGAVTAGAVRWLPAAPAQTDAGLRRLRVGAL
jgi:hypothetical protein